ncbi:hypothetical protein M422DRAFT_264591 [Sphaerobolus stellatus SS14]|uniref:NmrA-like domain-containing protein n=1 Tax=Sphaerobolus stellatus (strain SS14) TaxID=990650 RepID=A0A0C9UFE7_SPHS4|nr:hypothetical protein M422DRAFT_264591 [Sphaerobolus stellatus SS14]
MADAESILVLEMSELGMAVLRSIAHHPAIATVSVSVMVRPSTLATTSPAKAAELRELKSYGMNLIPGDVVNWTETELASYFQRYHTIISCTGFVGGRGVPIKLARVVHSANVKRYFPWQFGVDYDIIGYGSAQDQFDEQLDVRALLGGQEKTEWVIISTGMFTSFLFEREFGVVDVERGVVKALGGWENRVTVTSPNQVVHIAEDTVSYKDIANTLDRISDKKVTRHVWTAAELEDALRTNATDTMKKNRVVFAHGKGVSWDNDKTFNQQ